MVHATHLINNTFIRSEYLYTQLKPRELYGMKNRRKDNPIKNAQKNVYYWTFFCAWSLHMFAT
jgi:hypothetical protein